MTTSFRVPLHQLSIGPNVVAGCNPYVVMSLAYMMRSTREDPPAVLVDYLGAQRWSVTDGRHRFVAAVMAGRSDLLCRRVDDGEGVDDALHHQ